MVKKFVLWMAIAFAAVSCSDSTQYSIRGKISNAEDRYVYLDELKVSSTVSIDSVLLGKDGDFEFKGHVGYPTFFLLKLSAKNFVTLLVDSAEHVEVFGDAANFSRDYRVDGSEGSLQVQELNQRLSSTKHELDSIRSLQVSYRNLPDYPEKKKQWDEEYNRIREEQIQYSKNFIKEHPFAMANVLALYQKFNDDTYVIQDLQSLKVVASALNSFYPKSEHVKALYANTVKLMQDERSVMMQQFIQQAGQNSPEISLPDANGKNVALSSFQGKYVLLQFWSAIDRGSRIMNPVLVELYNKYHSKGFEIYQVSVDDNRYEWLDAIDQDGLKWTNVGDMQGSVAAIRTYNVQTVPFNYLLDREGAIIAKDLKGPALDQILKEVLK